MEKNIYYGKGDENLKGYHSPLGNDDTFLNDLYIVENTDLLYNNIEEIEDILFSSSNSPMGSLITETNSYNVLQMESPGASVDQTSNNNAIENEAEIELPQAKIPVKSRKGCLTCKSRKRKCDEGKPVCKECFRINMKCIYKEDAKRKICEPPISLPPQHSTQRQDLEVEQPFQPQQKFTSDSDQSSPVEEMKLKTDEIILSGMGPIKLVRGKVEYKIEDGKCIYRA